MDGRELVRTDSERERERAVRMRKFRSAEEGEYKTTVAAAGEWRWRVAPRRPGMLSTAT